MESRARRVTGLARVRERHRPSSRPLPCLTVIWRESYTEPRQSSVRSFRLHSLHRRGLLKLECDQKVQERCLRFRPWWISGGRCIASGRLPNSNFERCASGSPEHDSKLPWRPGCGNCRKDAGPRSTTRARRSRLRSRAGRAASEGMGPLTRCSARLRRRGSSPEPRLRAL